MTEEELASYPAVVAGWLIDWYRKAMPKEKFVSFEQARKHQEIEVFPSDFYENPKTSFNEILMKKGAREGFSVFGVHRPFETMKIVFFLEYPKE